MQLKLGVRWTREKHVNLIIVFVAWCILLAISWPVALLVLVLTPFVRLVSLAFRFVGLGLGAVFALASGLLFLPARRLGYRS